MAILESPRILSLSDPHAKSLHLTGGKGANLAKLVSAGLPVPKGFCVTTVVYTALTEDDDLSASIEGLDATDPFDSEQLRDRAEAEEHGVEKPNRKCQNEIDDVFV